MNDVQGRGVQLAAGAPAIFTTSQARRAPGLRCNVQARAADPSHEPASPGQYRAGDLHHEPGPLEVNDVQGRGVQLGGRRAADFQKVNDVQRHGVQLAAVAPPIFTTSQARLK